MKIIQEDRNIRILGRAIGKGLNSTLPSMLRGRARRRTETKNNSLGNEIAIGIKEYLQLILDIIDEKNKIIDEHINDSSIHTVSAGSNDSDGFGG